MTVSFVFLEVSNMEVPVNREIPLDNARLLLDRQNEIAKENEIAMTFTYGLIEDNTTIYESHVTLPIDDFSLFKAICKDIEGQDFEGKEAFKKWLSTTFKEKIHKAKEQKKQKAKPKRQLPVINKKMLIAFFVGLLILLISSVSLYYLSTAAPVPDKVSFDELIKQESFEAAAEEFPDRIDEIENKLFELTRSKDGQYLEALRTFHDKYPTKNGSFDLAMFSFEYEQVVALFEENKEAFESDTTRLTLAGYAYLKMDDLENSKALLDQSKSTELEKLVRQYEQLQLIIEEKEKEIKELQKKPTENKEKIEQAINDLYEAKEELGNF